MLDYEWCANPSTVILSDDHSTNQPAPIDFHHQTNSFHTNHQLGIQNTAPLYPPNHLYSLYNSRAYSHSHTAVPSLISSSSDYFVVPKAEDHGTDQFSSRIGLNLGGRTYFSSAEDELVSRLYRRSRPILDHGGLPSPSPMVNVPRCQAEGCNVDLTHAKHYHRRHKVCEFHSKASTVIAHGLTQRFCQQCSRFHLLAEFDNGKRSCRKRLADHNRRRRKSNAATQDASRNCKSPRKERVHGSPSETPLLSPRGSPSSVTLALSPPKISLDCFKQRAFQSGNGGALSSFFFSSG